MTGQVVSVVLNGAEPLAAAARFYAEYLPEIEKALAEGGSLVIRFDHAEDKPHRWRREAVAALARKYAPARVNALAPAMPDVADAHMAEMVAFLSANEGVTGHLLLVD